MNELQQYANIIPVINKADGFEPDELLQFKNIFIQKANIYNIDFFDVEAALQEQDSSDEDKTGLVKQMKAGKQGVCPPYAIVSAYSKIYYSVGGIRVGRQYNYGFCDIMDDRNTDFIKLYRSILFSYGYIVDTTLHIYNHFRLKREKNIE